MIVYNVTVKINPDVHKDWITWMKEVHIPDVMKTGYFKQNNIYKVMVDENDGITYSIQYHCDSMEKLHEYYEKESPRLQADHTARYKDKYVAFRTILEHVHETTGE